MSNLGSCNTTNQALIQWVKETADLCQPDRVYWCDGTEAERRALTEQAVADGVLLKLNQKKLPGCYYHRSNPNDVARVEQCTYICTDTRGRGRSDQQLGAAQRDVASASTAWPAAACKAARCTSSRT